MGIARINLSTQVEDNNWGTYATLTSSPTAASLSVNAGDFLILRGLLTRSAGGADVTFNVPPIDNQANVWTLTASSFGPGLENGVYEYWAIASATGILNVNLQASYDNCYTNFCFGRYSGVNTGSPVFNVGTPISANIDTTVTNPSVLTATAAGAGDMISAMLQLQFNLNRHYTASGSNSPSNVILKDGDNTTIEAQGRGDEMICLAAGAQSISIGYDPGGTSSGSGIVAVYRAAAATNVAAFPWIRA